MSRVINKKIINVLREEYDNRLRYFLSEKISIKDKRGNNLVKYAKGLKVRDKAGFEYTFIDIVEKDGQEYIKLYLPEFGRDIAEIGNESTSKLFEVDGDVEYDEEGFYSRKSDIGYDISPTNDGDGVGFGGLRDESDFDGDEMNDDGAVGSDMMGDVKKVSNVKKEKVKYILVPLGEFEERFSV